MKSLGKLNLKLEFCFLGLLALLWGSSYLFIKVSVSEIPPITLIALRVSIAALFLLAVVKWRDEKLPCTCKDWRMLWIQSFFNSIGAWTVLAWGQQYVDSGLASVLNSTSPIFVLFITCAITRHEAVNGLKLIGALIGFCGVILIVGVDVLSGLGQQVAGQLAAVAGAFLYACAAIYGKKFSHIKASVVATGTMIMASITLVPLSLIIEHPWTLNPTWESIVAALVLGVFCTGLALIIYFRLVKTLGSIGVASQSYLRAGVGVLLGIMILDEMLTPIVGIGIVTAIIGVAAINIPKQMK